MENSSKLPKILFATASIGAATPVILIGGSGGFRPLSLCPSTKGLSVIVLSADTGNVVDSDTPLRGVVESQILARAVVIDQILGESVAPPGKTSSGGHLFRNKMRRRWPAKQLPIYRKDLLTKVASRQRARGSLPHK